MATKQNQRAQAESAQKQALQQQQFAKNKIQMQMMKREIGFLKGRDQAVQQGGLTGLIDYLGKTRPKEGLALQQQQQKLNQSIQMTTGNSVKLFEQRQEALANNFYGPIMALKTPAERQKMYAEMLPQIKEIDPKAPDKFNKIRAISALGQVMPVSKLAAIERDQMALKGKIGENINNLNKLLQQGQTKDSPAVKIIAAELKGVVAAAEKKELELVEKKMSFAKEEMGRAKILRDSVDKIVNFEHFQTEIKPTHAEAKVNMALKYNDRTGVDDTTLITMVARLREKGVLTDQDIARYASSVSMFGQLDKLMEKVKSGRRLAKEEVENLGRTLMRSLEAKNESFKEVLEKYKPIAKKYGVDIKEVIPIDPLDLSAPKKASVVSPEYLKKVREANPDIDLSDEELTAKILKQRGR
jgi:hypothetical protein